MAGLGHGGPARFAGGEKYEGSIKESRILSKIMNNGKKYWKGFLAAFVIILASAGIEIIRPNITRIIIDDNIQLFAIGELSREVVNNNITRYGLIFLGIMICQFVFSYLQVYILQYTGKNIIKDLRQRVFSHLQKLPVAFFDKNPAGILVTRVTNDTEAINQMYTDVAVNFFKEIILVVGIIIVMFTFNVKLTIVSLIFIPLVLILIKMFRKRARVIFNSIRNKLGELNAFLSENIMGVKIIQVFNMIGKKKDEFSKLSNEYFDASNKMVNLFGLFRPSIAFINNLSIALVIWVSTKGIMSGSLELGMLYLFTRYTNMLFQPIIRLSEMFNTMQSSLVASERVFKLLETEPDSLVDTDLIEGQNKLNKLHGYIEFINVWFTYDENIVDKDNINWILKDVSFRIEKGERVAFVGATGAGKTTIINLICGFYKIQRGKILIDGINVNDIPKLQLRKSIGLVLQDVQLFAGNIASNIRLYDKEITDEQIIKAAKYVDAHRFITKMPNGYKSKVYYSGTTFSNGERQLLSFARAVVRDPAIMILDEATSNVDTETESLIQKALKKVSEGRTTLAIAHRLSTIKNSNRIIVIHKGELREEGNHEELIKLGGIYYNLYTLQFAG